MLTRSTPGRFGVTIVVPAFNEAARLPTSLPLLVEAVRQLPVTSEVVLVDDGSTDRTAAVATRHLSGLPDTHVLRLPWNCGKGTAVRTGVAVARGSVIVFLDADLASDLVVLPHLLSLLDVADIALGSRTAPGAVVTGRTPLRDVAAATYRQLVKSLTAAAVEDTQCGLKAFRGPVAKLLFSMTRASGFGFDVEVLALATALGMRIQECPVRWTAVEGGHVSLRRHGPGMLHDLHRARRHQQRARTARRAPTVEPFATWPATPASVPTVQLPDASQDGSAPSLRVVTQSGP